MWILEVLYRPVSSVVRDRGPKVTDFDTIISFAQYRNHTVVSQNIGPYRQFTCQDIRSNGTDKVIPDYSGLTNKRIK